MLFKLISDSFFIRKIDYIILFLLTLLLISLTFASTIKIGLIAGLCFLMLLLKLLFKEGEKLTFSAFDKPIIFYVLIMGISVLFSPYFMHSLKGYFKLLTYLCLYLTFSNVLDKSMKKTYYLLIVIALTGFAESLTAIYQNFSGIEALASWQDRSGLNPEQIMTRVYGTLQPFNPNLLAGYLVATISSTVGGFFLFAAKKNFRIAGLFLAAFLSIAGAIVFTGSRGAYIALFIMVTGIVMTSGHIIWHDFKEKLLYKRLWIYIVLMAVIVGIFIIIVSPALQHRIMSIFVFREDSSNSFRFNVYLSAIKMFLDNWLIGIGPGNETFRLVYGIYMKTGFDALGAYCVPLEIAVESGIFALLAFSWLILNVFINGVKTVLFGQNIEQKIIVLICVISIAGIMGHGLVDTIFFRPQVQVLFWLYVAIFKNNFLRSDKI